MAPRTPTAQQFINSFNAIFALLDIPSPFRRIKAFPSEQINIFMVLATMASYKAASSCLVAKCAAEDVWLLSRNSNPVIDAVLWKRVFKGIQVYKGVSLKDKSTVLPSQVRKKIQYMISGGEHLTIDGASMILYS